MNKFTDWNVIYYYIIMIITRRRPHGVPYLRRRFRHEPFFVSLIREKNNNNSTVLRRKTIRAQNNFCNNYIEDDMRILLCAQLGSRQYTFFRSSVSVGS